jgi:peptidyl-dipeptidase Dcp
MGSLSEVSMRVLPSLLVTAGLVLPLSAAAKQEVNPFFREWKTPFGVPPFGEIKEDHFLPAIKEGIDRQKKEVAAIAESQKPPTFKNTVEALELSGQFLSRVTPVFFSLVGAETNPKLQAINREVAPLLSAMRDDINLNGKLWERVKTVWEQREKLKLNAEQAKLLEDTYKGFVRSGANLTVEQKNRMRALNDELSKLSVEFADRLLKATKSYKLVVDKSEDLAGLTESERTTAAQAAKKAGLEGKWLFTLDGPSLWPFLQHAENRELRKQIYTAYLERCQGGDTDNRGQASRIAVLRLDKAKLLGYKTWADFVLEENMAKNSTRVYQLLEKLWKPSLEMAKRDRAELQAVIDAEKGGFKLEPWDWRFYEEKVRKAKYDFDEGLLKPYFSLDRVREGAFFVANKLYGVTFTERKDLPTYNSEVKTFEVKEKDGHPLGVLYVDYYPRPGKRGGAWCGNFRGSSIKAGKKVDAVMTNVCNFTRPSGDAPALLTTDEVRTLFHEFGHSLHGLFYKGRYRGLAGTPRDFVELPSQVMENWSMEPEVLKVYAKHYKTGEVIPQTLVQKLTKADTYGQGYATVEYLAASLLDLDWHTLTDAKEPDANAFEKASLEKWGLIPEIPSRYRTPYFQHIFAGGYSSGYYGYIWCGVLDSDAFQAFKDKGNLFDPATAKSFRTNILEKGGTEDLMTMYKRFRGAEPSVEPLLKKRGLLQKN